MATIIKQNEVAPAIETALLNQISNGDTYTIKMSSPVSVHVTGHSGTTAPVATWGGTATVVLGGNGYTGGTASVLILGGL